MIGIIFVLLYLLRGLQFIGWCDMLYVLDYLFVDGVFCEGMLVVINVEKMLVVEDNLEVWVLIEVVEFKYVDGISVVCLLCKKYLQVQVFCVVGVDFWEVLMQCVGVEGILVFLVGGKFEVLVQIEFRLCQCWQVNIVGSQDGYFIFE